MSAPRKPTPDADDRDGLFVQVETFLEDEFVTPCR
jgi:hypothetical protein